MVPAGADGWATRGTICASTHDIPEQLPCTRIDGDGSFALSLRPGTYWLCGPDRYSCSSLCPYEVLPSSMLEVDAGDLIAPMPGAQGFYGTSTGTFGEPGYLDVAHPLVVCAGPPDTPLRAPVAQLRCARTDRCGRYALSLPPGSYRVSFAEPDASTTMDRERCRYELRAGQRVQLDRLTGRVGRRPDESCPEGASADPISREELIPLLDELGSERPPPALHDELIRVLHSELRQGSSFEQVAEALIVEVPTLLEAVGRELRADPALRGAIPPLVATDERNVAFPMAGESHARDERVHLRGAGFGDQQGVVMLSGGAGEFVTIASAELSWSEGEISFPRPSGLAAGRYELELTRADGLSSFPRSAVVEFARADVQAQAPDEEQAPDVDCLLDPTLPKCKATGDSAHGPPALDRPVKLGVTEIKRGIDAIKPAVKACAVEHDAEPGTKVTVKFELSGVTGTPTSIEIREEHAGTPLGECVASKASQAKFPTFTAQKQSFTYKFRL